MSYREALERLFDLSRFGERYALDKPRALNAALGDPLARYRSVLIGGTNGKGSTAAFLEALLRHRGIKTGLFTSPHLVSFRERIRVDGEDISEAEVQVLSEQVLALGLTPSFFEAAWAMATLAFARAGVEVAIWEVGLGGRLDATNVCEPVASAVVSVDLDHTHILGDTLEEIIAEKVAIFRPGRPALTTDSRVPAELVDARALGPLPLPGAHQQRNASLALALAEAIGVDARVEALQGVRWPGRCESFGQVRVDCAHNPASAAALAAWIRESYAEPPRLIFGAMRTKDVRQMAESLAPVVSHTTLVTPSYARRRSAESLADDWGAHPHTVGGSVAEALDAVTSPTLVAGSCFLAGEARAHLLGLEFPECGLHTKVR